MLVGDDRTTGGRRRRSQTPSQAARSRKTAMAAKCYDCCAGYADGRRDCEVTRCPIYPWMPYRKLEPDYGWVGWPSRIGWDKR